MAEGDMGVGLRARRENMAAAMPTPPPKGATTTAPSSMRPGTWWRSWSQTRCRAPSRCRHP